MSCFTNKKVVISGAAGNMAECMIELLLQQGAHIVALDINIEQLQNKYNTTKNVSCYQCDISNADELNKLANNLHGDMLINHAGVATADSLTQTFANVETWHKDININLTGTFNLTNIFISQAVKQKQPAAIVTISSVNADIYYGNPAYSAAKAGLNSFNKSIASEYGKLDIRANIVSPASVMTEAWKKRLAKTPDLEKKILKWYPLGKLVTPMAVAKAVLFLLSDDSKFITGINLRVDAGLSAGNMPFTQEITL